MVNWMMGHNESPLDFKAFVSHDGIFNTLQTAYSTDELYFPEHDHGGTPVQKREEYEKFNPLNFVGKWKTPCLVIHSRKDCESSSF
jgi:dipeptidyl aminopeptidase/acylaminoacyl peptidase